MNTKLLKIAFLSVMFLAISQVTWAQKKTVVVEKSTGDKKKTTTTIVLKVTKDENGKITSIDTTFTSDKTADSVEYAITQTFDFDSDGMKNLDHEIKAMIKEFKIDSLGRLSETIDFDIDTDSDEGSMTQAPCCPPFPQGYSHNFNWNNFPNQWNLQQFLNDNLMNKSIKIKTRKGGKKIIIKIERNDDVVFMMPPFPPMGSNMPCCPQPSKANKKSKMIIINKDCKK